MLFSGASQAYKCPECGEIYSNIVPTSLLPILVIFFSAVSLWSGFFALLFFPKWLVFAASLGAAVASMALSYVLVERISSKWLSTLSCLKCGSKLVASGSGFVDGGLPQLQEILLYLLQIALPLSSWILAAWCLESY